jgi:hypothetical protein
MWEGYLLAAIQALHQDSRKHGVDETEAGHESTFDKGLRKPKKKASKKK